MLKKRALIALALAAELAVLAFLGLMIFRRDQSSITLEPSADMWSSGVIAGYEAGAPMTIDGDTPLLNDFDKLAAYHLTRGTASGGIKAFCGLVGDLAPSGYTVSVEYSCDADQYVSYDCAEGSAGSYAAGKLRAGKDRRADFDLYAWSGLKTFRIFAEYTGEGALTVSRVTLTTNSAMQRMAFVLAAFAFLLLDGAWLSRRQLKKHRVTAAALLAILLLISLPLTSGFIANGHDLAYHLMRIEAEAQGLAAGQFPVRTASNFFDGMGDASPVFYCGLLLFFPAMLRLMGFPVMMAYGAYILFINVLTVFISYGCFRRIFRNEKITLAAVLLWCTSAYRFSNVYFRASVGEYSAMAFLPLIALAVFRMYDERNTHSILHNALLLAAGMAMTLMTHLLSVEMVCVVLAVLALLRFRQTFTGKTLLTWLAATGLTVLLSLWFLVPLAEYYLSVPVLINTGSMGGRIQQQGASLADLTDIFKNVYTVTNSGWPMRRLLMTPGAALLVLFAFSVKDWVCGTAGKHEKQLTAASAVLLLAATNMFPWDIIASLPVLKLLTAVQIPWRYVGPASFVMTLAGACWLQRIASQETEYGRRMMTVTAFLCAAGIFFYTGAWVDNGAAFEAMGALDSRMEAEYSEEYARVLPAEGDSRYPAFGLRDELLPEAQTQLLERSGDHIVLRASAQETSAVTFPHTNYLYYEVTDEAGRAYTISDDEACRIRVTVPAGFDGMLTLGFREPVHWRAAEGISLLTLLACAALCLRKKRRAA